MSGHGFRQRALTVTRQKSADADSTDRFLWDIHKYTNDYIRFADTKAAFVAAASTALIGALVGSSALDSCFRAIPGTWLQWGAMAGLLLLAASLVLSVLAIRPRLWNHSSVGYIFWESIKGHKTARAFSQAVSELPASGRTTATSDHLFMLASVATRKYGYVKWAIHAGIAGGLLAGVVLFMRHALK
jgi:hypothetical protein